MLLQSCNDRSTMWSRIFVLQVPVGSVSIDLSRKGQQMIFQELGITLASHISVEHNQLGFAREGNSGPHVKGSSLLLSWLNMSQHPLHTPHAKSVITVQSKPAFVRKDDSPPLLHSLINSLRRPLLSA